MLPLCGLENQCREMKPAVPELASLDVVVTSLPDIVTGVLGIYGPQIK